MEEVGDLPQGKTAKSPKLKIFLLCLAVAIAVLAITMVIMVNNKDKENEKDNPEMTLEEYYDEYFKEVDKIYDNNPDNITKVTDYFANDINSQEDIRMSNAIGMEKLWFDIRGIKEKEALLEGLVKIDYSKLSNSDAYSHYSDLIGLARELNRNDVIEEYTILRNEVKDDYWLAIEASRKNLENDIEHLDSDVSDEMRDVIQKQYDYILLQIEKYKEENNV